MKSFKSHSSGFSLIEVLVALVVLSIGLLGVAALHLTALKNNASSQVRTQMTLAAYDLSDRMRANREAALNGAYDDDTSGTANASCNGTSGCSAQAMASNDLFEWHTKLDSIAPGAEGIVCVDSTPNDGTDSGSPACSGSGEVRAIKIWWPDERDGALVRLSTGVRP
ncbi:type IV pilus modification protein PilV [Guyparkeria halophila]|uniref:Type IV pilus modification protein PilV n=1 Tax=Guyparkeria halophila TaxID=47960 RepID=A0A6I6CW34_9GAMM|nr:type IV pilus modification protein PilV [Guyparkeria halophila]QGT77490.1 type IV pilus modification protein PilV [Guyparkeria halophila]